MLKGNERNSNESTWMVYERKRSKLEDDELHGRNWLEMNGNENNMEGNERAWMERNIEGHVFLSGVAVLVKKLSFFLAVQGP